MEKTEAKIITITNQKGGVGKSTTAQNMSALLAKKGNKTLVIDLDPQCNLTYAVKADTSKPDMRDVFKDEATAAEAVQHLGENYYFIASNKNLDNTMHDLDALAQVYKLKKVLKEIKNVFDYIIIDTPPALSPLTINALVASNSVIIPVQADSFSMQGAESLAKTINGIKEVNEALSIDGILIVRYKSRAVLSRQMADNFTRFSEILGTKVFGSRIREAIAVQESQLKRTNLFDYEKSNVADDYAAFVEEYING